MFESFIKHGAFGCVEIIRGSDGALLARKHLEPKESILESADPEKIRARFKREVRVQKQLPSDYFMPILEAGLDDDPPWFIMPCADETFEEYIKCHRGKTDVFHAPLMDILNALEVLEKLEYKHRDLKPGNILRHEGKWKLSDFGLVSAAIEASGPLSSAHSAWGSQPYCSPEQTLDFKNVTCATDIYSFGCILHDIFSKGQRVPYRQHTADGPIGAVIERCTAEDPNKRFKSVAGLRSALALAVKSRPDQDVSSSTEQWIDRLKDVATWDIKTHEDFRRLLRQPLGKHEQKEIFLAFDPDSFCYFEKFPEVWKELVDYYTTHTRGTHDFNFCDVIGSNLSRIYEMGTLTDKIGVTLAAAYMGRTHHRYYVMKIVQRFASPTVDDCFAMRLAIEINAEDAATDFRECAPIREQTANSYNCYHPLVAEAIRRAH